ncbi:MAG: helicase-related protein [Lentisphaeria bacterium]|nr:helicase-related protein [Lentisphaeria bacterium]
MPPDDPKFDALMRVVENKRQSPNPRIMLFSTFLHTLRYLETRLTAAGVRVGLVHGGVPDPERMALRRRFMLPTGDAEAIDLLLFSEVGCEGLDYQFCDTLVNYDLPWNPMRIEQRIGRLDRNGQQSEAVFIYNLITTGTIDADIYSRCLLRIGIFERSVGECEDILGDLTRDIGRIAADTQLSADERQAKLQQLADNQLRLAAERSELERNQKAFFGLDLSEQRFRDDIDAACSSWIAPRAVENLIDRYLRSLAAGKSPMLGGGKVKTLRLSQDLRNALLAELKAADLPSGDASRRWRKLLTDAEPYIKVAFESAAAANDSTIELLSPLHPLLRLAARKTLAESATCHAALEVRCADAPAGIYPFVVHEWRREGVRPELELKPVCADPCLQTRLGELLPQATSWRIEAGEFPAKTVFDALEATHYQMWTAARERHREDTRALADHRLRSLQTSHQARYRVLEQKIEQATDDRIRRMHTSELATANHDSQRRQADLEKAVERADIHAQPIAWGVLKVEGCHEC